MIAWKIFCGRLWQQGMNTTDTKEKPLLVVLLVNYQEQTSWLQQLYASCPKAQVLDKKN